MKSFPPKITSASVRIKKRSCSRS